MNIFLVDVNNEDYHGLLGTDLLQREDRVYIFISGISGRIPELYADILKASKSDIHIIRLSDTDDPVSRFEEITADNEADNIYMICRGNKQMRRPVYHTVLEAAYMTWHKGSKKRLLDCAPVEKAIEGNRSLYRIAGECGLDPDAFIGIVSKNENDKRRLYQELLHEFGNKSGTQAYQMMKAEQTGPFTPPEKPVENHEPIIYRYLHYYTTPVWRGTDES